MGLCMHAPPAAVMPSRAQRGVVLGNRMIRRYDTVLRLGLLAADVLSAIDLFLGVSLAVLRGLEACLAARRFDPAVVTARTALREPSGP